jgi:hypothetical protein
MEPPPQMRRSGALSAGVVLFAGVVLTRGCCYMKGRLIGGYRIL